MNWTALGIVTTIVIAISGGICTLFSMYLNARFDAALDRMEKEMSREMNSLGDEIDEHIKNLNGIYLRTGIWTQFYNGEFSEIRRRQEIISDWRHNELPKQLADLHLRIDRRNR